MAGVECFRNCWCFERYRSSTVPIGYGRNCSLSSGGTGRNWSELLTLLALQEVSKTSARPRKADDLPRLNRCPSGPPCIAMLDPQPGVSQ